jgi:hypothetical protein
MDGFLVVAFYCSASLRQFDIIKSFAKLKKQIWYDDGTHLRRVTYSQLRCVQVEVD